MSTECFVLALGVRDRYLCPAEEPSAVLGAFVAHSAHWCACRIYQNERGTFTSMQVWSMWGACFIKKFSRVLQISTNDYAFLQKKKRKETSFLATDRFLCSWTAGCAQSLGFPTSIQMDGCRHLASLDESGPRAMAIGTRQGAAHSLDPARKRNSSDSAICVRSLERGIFKPLSEDLAMKARWLMQMSEVECILVIFVSA